MYNVTSVFISIFLLLTTNRLFSVLKRRDSDLLIEWVFYYKTVFYLLVPAVFRVFSGGRFDREIGIEAYEILAVYLIEVGSTIVWLIVYVSASRLPSRFYLKSSPHGTQPRLLTNDYEGIAQITLLLYAFFFFADAARSFGFDLTVSTDVLWPLKEYARVAGSVIAFFVLPLWSRFRKITRLLAALGLLVFVSQSILSGIRGNFVHSAFFLLFVSLCYGSNKRFAILAGASLLSLLAFQASFSMLRYARHTTLFAIEEATASSTAPERTTLEEIEWRYGESTRLSVALLREVSDGRFAGVRPLLNSLYAPLPRRFFPDKPIPGSVSGAQSGMAMYFVSERMRGQPWNMVEILSGIHAYWEGGLLGVLIIMVFSALYVSSVVRWFSRLGMLAVPMSMAIMKPWGYNEPRVQSWDVPLQVFQILVPLIAIVVLYKLFARVRRTIFPAGIGIGANSATIN